MKLLTVSIVIHELDEKLFRSVLMSLASTVQQAGMADDILVVLVDNGCNQPRLEPLLEDITNPGFTTTILQQAENRGFGAGHNAALKAYPGRFHLILNPDVLLGEDTISLAMKHFETHEDTVLICPHGCDEKGRPAFLSKRYPALVTLAARAFGTSWWISKANARYEYHDLPVNEPAEVELASGCCMFARGDALRSVEGFNEQYFLYFEDFDLSLRLATLGKVMHLPRMTITHYGGEAARKGLRHWLYFCRSGIRFFNAHGWKLFQY